MSELFRTPRSEAKLVELTDALIEGARTYATTLSLSPDFETAMTTDRDALGVAQNQHKTDKETLRQAANTRRMKEAEATAYVVAATHVLRTKFGTRKNPQWELVGLRQGSTANPRNATETLARLQALETYFTANPTSEVPSLDATAAKAALHRKAVTDANFAYNSALTIARTAMQTRVEAKKKLGAQVRSFAEALTTVLGPSDRRWYTFGLRRPVDLRIPEVPGKPTVHQTGLGVIEIDIPRATRAKRYRVYVQKPQDQEPMLVATVTDRLALLKDLPPATKLKIQVSATNKSGESATSEPVEIQLQ